MRTNPNTECPIRTCTVIALGHAVNTGDVEMAESTLRHFPIDTWVTVTPLGGLPGDDALVVEITTETDDGAVAAMVTASKSWFMVQPTLLTVHHNLGRLLADSVDLSHPALAPNGHDRADPNTTEANEGPTGEAA